MYIDTLKILNSCKDVLNNQLLDFYKINNFMFKPQTMYYKKTINRYGLKLSSNLTSNKKLMCVNNKPNSKCNSVKTLATIQKSVRFERSFNKMYSKSDNTYSSSTLQQGKKIEKEYILGTKAISSSTLSKSTNNNKCSKNTLNKKNKCIFILKQTNLLNHLNIEHFALCIKYVKCEVEKNSILYKIYDDNIVDLLNIKNVNYFEDKYLLEIELENSLNSEYIDNEIKLYSYITNKSICNDKNIIKLYIYDVNKGVKTKESLIILINFLKVNTILYKLNSKD